MLIIVIIIVSKYYIFNKTKPIWIIKKNSIISNIISYIVLLGQKYRKMLLIAIEC